MRIRRKIELAGLAVALAGGVSGTAEAGDRTISTAVTTPVVTSNPDGSTVAGDVTVTSTGSITVAAGQSAITVDSNNDVTVDGQLLSTTNADNVTGIRIGAFPRTWASARAPGFTRHPSCSSISTRTCSGRVCPITSHGLADTPAGAYSPARMRS